MIIFTVFYSDFHILIDCRNARFYPKAIFLSFYSIQHYVIKLVNDLRQVGGFQRLLKVALSTMPPGKDICHELCQMLIVISFSKMCLPRSSSSGISWTSISFVFCLEISVLKGSSSPFLDLLSRLEALVGVRRLCMPFPVIGVYKRDILFALSLEHTILRRH